MLEHPILRVFFFSSSPIYTNSLTDLRHSAVGKLEMLDLPSLNAEIQRLREIEMLQWICQLRPRHPHWEGPENILTTTVRNRPVKRTPTSLKDSVTALLFRPDLTMVTAVTELESLNATGVIISWLAGICQRQGQYGDHNGQQNSSNQNSLTCTDLRH